jgi:hypothetical protein
MTENIDLKRLEKRAWLEYQRDGLTEIIFGIFLFAGAALLRSTSYIGFYAILVIYITPLVESLRKKYTYPRIGRVKLQQDAPKKTFKGIFGFLILVLIIMSSAFIIFTGSIGDAVLWRKWTPTWVGAMMLGAFTFSASKTGAFRYRVYGISAFIGGIIFSLNNSGADYTGIEYYLLAMSAVLIPIGIVQFFMFIKDNPLPAEVAADAGI